MVPILFIVYTSEIPSLAGQFIVMCKMFADDTKIYKNICSREDHTALQSAISAIAGWSAEWEVPLLGQKSSLLHLGKQTNRNNRYFKESQLCFSATLRGLGSILDTKLSFKEKAARVVHGFFKSLRTNSVKHLLLVSQSHVRPILVYGTSVFSPLCKRNIARLESVQNSSTGNFAENSMNMTRHPSSYIAAKQTIQAENTYIS